MYTAQEVWEHRQKHTTGVLGDQTQEPYRLTFQFQFYDLMEVDIGLLRIGGKSFDLPLSSTEDEECAKNEYAYLRSKAPAIVVHPNSDGTYSVIDGRHRSRAAYLRGERRILAFVGIK